jgi:hypothetical protein
MQNLKFDKWWNDIIERHKGDKDGGYSEVEDIEREIGSLTQNIQEYFIWQLFEINHPQIASILISNYGNDEQKQKIRALAANYIEENNTDSSIIEYIKTIIKTYSPTDHDFLKDYFLNHQKDKWFIIPNELYDIDKILFLEAYEKKFPNIEDVFLFESYSYIWLASRIDIMEYLINNLSKEQSNRLKKMAFVKSQYSIISKENRNKLLLLSKLE